MEVENLVFLEKNNNKCGYIGNSKRQFCKVNNYCSQDYKCKTRTGTYNERTAYKYNKYESFMNNCTNKATVIFSIIKLNSITHLPSQREFLP